MGNTLSIISEVEYLLIIADKCNILSLFPAPSAFIICGVMALSTDVRTNEEADFICSAMPNDALMIAPKKLFIITAIPWLRSTAEAVSTVVHPANLVSPSRYFLLMSSLLILIEHSSYFSNAYPANTIKLISITDAIIIE